MPQCYQGTVSPFHQDETPDHFQYVCQKPWISHPLLANCSFAQTSSYRGMCEHTAWDVMRGESHGRARHDSHNNGSQQYYLSTSDPDLVHCRGHRPSQFISRSSVCDGKIDCIDRSDESDCDATSETGVRLYWVGKKVLNT